MHDFTLYKRLIVILGKSQNIVGGSKPGMGEGFLPETDRRGCETILTLYLISLITK